MAIDHPWLGPTRPLLESPRTAYQQPCPSSPLPRMHACLPACRNRLYPAHRYEVGRYPAPCSLQLGRWVDG
jgi:hypothetical protein